MGIDPMAPRAANPNTPCCPEIAARIATLYGAFGESAMEKAPMRYVIAAMLLGLLAATAHAQGATCKAQSGEKKLAGAALKSFMTKCEKDAKAACDKSAAEKKLAGAAKTSHLKKCVGDAVGS